MHFSRSFAVIVGLGALLHPGQGIAEPLCKPEIAIKSVRLSEPISLKRYWTAIVNVDASACAASSGLFALGFARLSETAPDLEFAEPFIWRAGQTKVRVELWWDEAVERYWVADVAACPCRAK